MKIALLSDIHGNIDAFEAVLGLIKRDGVEKIFIAGDLVGYYYYADKVIDICMKNEEIYCIRGNHEQNFLNALDDTLLMSNFTKKYGSSYERLKKKLTNDQVNWLQQLPERLSFKINNVTITLAHSSMLSDGQYVYPDMPSETLCSQLSNSKFTVLGHTHHAFIWCKNNKYLVNPGSVGQPRDQRDLASFFYLDTTNGSLLPRKIIFPIKRLKRDVAKFDSNNKYLARALTGLTR